MLVLLYYGGYLLLSALLLLLFRRGGRQAWFIKLLIVAGLPLAGWLVVLIWSLRQRDQSEQQFAEYVEQQQQEHSVRRIGVFHRIEKQRELDVVPIEDALIISQHRDRRQALIEILKQDTIQYIEVLQQAIRNEDTETSHYAVSAIMEIKRKLLISLQELEVRYEQESGDAELSQAYAEVLSVYLRSGFLDERTKKKVQYTHLSVLAHHLREHDMDERMYEDKLNVELELELYPAAEQTALQYVERFPASERAYLSLLKYYFTVRSYQKLKDALERLKRSPIRLSNEGLTAVRFWSTGGAHEQQFQI